GGQRGGRGRRAFRLARASRRVARGAGADLGRGGAGAAWSGGRPGDHRPAEPPGDSAAPLALRPLDRGAVAGADLARTALGAAGAVGGRAQPARRDFGKRGARGRPPADDLGPHRATLAGMGGFWRLAGGFRRGVGRVGRQRAGHAAGRRNLDDLDFQPVALFGRRPGGRHLPGPLSRHPDRHDVAWPAGVSALTGLGPAPKLPPPLLSFSLRLSPAVWYGRDSRVSPTVPRYFGLPRGTHFP